MPDIFISYASQDTARVRPLVNRLASEGWDIWWDREIISGQLWESAIEKAVATARCMVVIWSERSVESDWVRTEAAEGLARDCLVPVLIDPVVPPLRFRQLHCRRLTGWPDGHDPHELDGLVADITARLARTTPRVATPAAPAPGLALEAAERRPASIVSALIDHDGDDEDPEAVLERTQAWSAAVGQFAREASAIVLHNDVNGFALAFGVTEAQEDDEIHAAESAFALNRLLGHGHGLDVRFGLATGLVVVTTTAAGGQISGTALATAAAMAQRAMPGEIWCQASAAGRLAPYFAMDRAGDGARLMARTEVRSRLDAARALGLSPLFGRRLETALLDALVDDVQGGSGRALALVADAGLGKSRLLHELALLATERGVRIGHGRGRLYNRSRPFGVFADLLRDLVGVDADANGERLAHALQARSPALAPLLPELLAVLGAEHPAHALPPAGDAQSRKRQLGQAVIAALAIMAADQPLALLFDDWHRADEASAELMPQLAAMAAAHPMLIALALAPDTPVPWPTLPHCSQMVLRPLARGDVAALVAAISRSERVAPDLLARLTEQSDGVPLFIEELVRALLEDGAIVARNGELVAVSVNRAMPDSIEAVVRARLDRLEPAILSLLRVASVMGRDFGRAFLDAHFGGAAELGTLLDRAVALGLIQQTRLLPEPVWRFRHAATWQVAHDSLLMKRRRSLHAEAAAWLGAQAADDADSLAETLAMHCAEAAQPEAAAGHFMRASQRAARGALYRQAASFAQAAADQLASLPAGPEVHERLLEARVAAARALFLVKGYGHSETIAAVDGIKALMDTATAGAGLVPALWVLFRHAYNIGQMAPAMAAAARLEQLCADDPVEGSRARMAVALVHLLMGEPLRALGLLDDLAALPLPADERDYAERVNVSPLVQAWTIMGLARVRVGDVAGGWAAFDRAEALADEIGHASSKAFVLGYRDGAAHMLADMDAAEAAATRLKQVAEQHDLVHWDAHARMKLAMCRLVRGDVSVVPAFLAAEADVQALGVVMVREQGLLLRALMAIQGQNFAGALALLDEAEALMVEGPRQLKPDIMRVRMLALSGIDMEAAVALGMATLDDCAATANHARAVQLACDLATILSRLGRDGEAIARLTSALAAIPADQRGAAPVFRHAQALLARLTREPQETAI